LCQKDVFLLIDNSIKKRGGGRRGREGGREQEVGVQKTQISKIRSDGEGGEKKERKEGCFIFA